MPVPLNRSIPAMVWCVIALGGLLAGALSVLLWPQWRNNPDLSHGLFVPAIFLILLHESRRQGSCRFLPETLATKILRTTTLVSGLVLIACGGLFAASLDWSHALVGFTLASALAALLCATLLWLAGDGVRVVPLNWSSLVAVGLWPLSAPIPPNTYQHITLKLQLLVTDVVLHALHLLGIPAITRGNIIELAHTSVGVEEACSGVRSLISCIVAGLFFSATLVRKPWARVLLVALAAPLAIGMNILRSLVLTLLANAGINIGGTWHDLTGFAELGVTAAILGGLALWLEDRAPAKPAAAIATRQPASALPPTRRWGVPAGLVAAVVLVGFFAYNTHDTSRADAPVPNLESFLPVTTPEWTVRTADDLSQFSSLLQTDHLLQRSYLRKAPSGPPMQITFYLAYWSAGQAPVSLVSSHTPDTCWPGSGWVWQAHTAAPSPFLVGGRTLPKPEYLLFKNDAYPQHVWYWHLYAGQPIPQIAPLSPRTFLKLALRYGFRAAGDQLFVRISSNQPWEALCDDPLVIEVLSHLQPLGL